MPSLCEFLRRISCYPTLVRHRARQSQTTEHFRRTEHAIYANPRRCCCTTSSAFDGKQTTTSINLLLGRSNGTAQRTAITIKIYFRPKREREKKQNRWRNMQIFTTHMLVPTRWMAPQRDDIVCMANFSLRIRKSCMTALIVSYLRGMCILSAAALKHCWCIVCCTLHQMHRRFREEWETHVGHNTAGRQCYVAFRTTIWVVGTYYVPINSLASKQLCAHCIRSISASAPGCTRAPPLKHMEIVRALGGGQFT